MPYLNLCEQVSFERGCNIPECARLHKALPATTPEANSAGWITDYWGI